MTEGNNDRRSVQDVSEDRNSQTQKVIKAERRRPTVVEWLTLFFMVGGYVVGFFFLYSPQTRIQVSTSEVQKSKDIILTEIAKIDQRTKEQEKDLSLREMRIKSAIDAWKAIQDIRPKIDVTGLSGVVVRPGDEPSLLRKDDSVEARFLIKNMGSFDVYFDRPTVRLFKLIKSDSKSLSSETVELEENKDYKFAYAGPHGEYPAHPGVQHRCVLSLWFKALDDEGQYTCMVDLSFHTMDEIIKLGSIFLNEFITSEDLSRITKRKFSFPIPISVANLEEAL